MTDQNFKTSFIPTKPIQPVSRGGRLGGGHGNFLNIITLGIFILSIVLSGGVFGYKFILEKNYDDGIEELENVKKSLDTPLVNEADRLNNRINSVKSIFDSHLAPSRLITLLESKTLKTIQFNSLSFRKEADGSFKITADGIANDYGSIVAQSEQYGKTTFLKDVLFSGLQPNSQGGVNFVLDAIVDQPLISFKKKVEDLNSGTPTEPVSNSPSKGDSFEFPNGTSTNN